MLSGQLWKDILSLLSPLDVLGSPHQGIGEDGSRTGVRKVLVVNIIPWMGCACPTLGHCPIGDAF